MRFQDMIKNGFKYLEEFTGPTRAKRRREEWQRRQRERGRGRGRGR